MQLVEQGKIRLSDPLSKYLPEIQDVAARQVTVQQLLTHLSGYGGGLDRTRPWGGQEGLVAEVAREPLRNPRGSVFLYSDINYIALGLVVLRVSGQDLATYSHEHVFAPLGIASTTGFSPRSNRSRMLLWNTSDPSERLVR